MEEEESRNEKKKKQGKSVELGERARVKNITPIYTLIQYNTMGKRRRRWREYIIRVKKKKKKKMEEQEQHTILYWTIGRKEKP